MNIDVVTRLRKVAEGGTTDLKEIRDLCRRSVDEITSERAQRVTITKAYYEAVDRPRRGSTLRKKFWDTPGSAVRDLVGIAGLAMIAVGIGMFSLPVGIIFAGLLIAGVVIFMSRDGT